MNIFKKIKDYDRLKGDFELSERQNNELRVKLQMANDQIDRHIEATEKLTAALNSVQFAVLSADKPEKRKYYTLALQKALLPYIWEKDGKIFIKVCNPGE